MTSAQALQQRGERHKPDMRRMSTVSKLDRDTSGRVSYIREAVNLLFVDACGDKAGHMLALLSSVKAGKACV